MTGVFRAAGGGVFNDDLGCFAVELSYSYADAHGTLRIAEGNKPNMSGVTRLFTAIDPDVELVAVYSGAKRVATYVRQYDRLDKLWRSVRIEK